LQDEQVKCSLQKFDPILVALFFWHVDRLHPWQ
jgi:hypothetical protein